LPLQAWFAAFLAVSSGGPNKRLKSEGREGKMKQRIDAHTSAVIH